MEHQNLPSSIRTWQVPGHCERFAKLVKGDVEIQHELERDHPHIPDDEAGLTASHHRERINEFTAA